MEGNYNKEISLDSDSVAYVKFNPKGKSIEYVGMCGGDEYVVIVCRRTGYQFTLDMVPEELALTELVNYHQSTK